jgi:hypothetical protein
MTMKKLSALALGAASCWLGCAQVLAGSLGESHSSGPAALRGTADSVLARIGMRGLPPPIRGVEGKLDYLKLIDIVPGLSHTGVQLTVGWRGSELWIEPKG